MGNVRPIIPASLVIQAIVAYVALTIMVMGVATTVRELKKGISMAHLCGRCSIRSYGEVACEIK